MSEKFYITTPIYYPSGKWHLGTCYTTIICDAIARFKRMQGADVFYLTGTDEHGQKIQNVAAAAGIDVKQYIDTIVDELKQLWKVLDISYDKFIRTTDEYHKQAVQKIFEKLYQKGDIYKSNYEGWYCTPCESYWTKSQLVDGKCPDCGRPVQLMKEESYFFKLSKYQDAIMKLLTDNPEFLQPVSRRNEMINNFLKPGLQDLCVSRCSFDWGVKVPFDPKHVVYVWLDALTNYITALGYGSEDTSLFDKFWPADLHMMAKEIIRFHAIIWPAFLMALDLPLPKKVFGHGWLLFDSDKMSKSKGNVVDPFILCDRYSTDAVRYYILKDVSFGQDGNFTNEIFLKRINSDLTNDLGNLVNRVTAMTEQYFGGVLPQSNTSLNEFDQDLIAMAEGMLGKVTSNIDNLIIQDCMEEIWKVIRRANKYIDECTPWVLAKSEQDKPRLATVIYNLCETIRFVAVILQPFLTKVPNLIFEKIGVDKDNLKTFDSIKKFGLLKQGTKITKGEAIFKRYDVAKELEEMETIAEQTQNKKKECDKVENVVSIQEIGIEDFEKVQLKVGKVVACEKVAKADKLLCSQVDLGEGKLRTIVSGIAKWYTPEQMIGKSVVVVANLKSAKLRGIESQGMLLCASDQNDNLCLVSPINDICAGSEVR